MNNDDVSSSFLTSQYFSPHSSEARPIIKSITMELDCHGVSGAREGARDCDPAELLTEGIIGHLHIIIANSLHLPYIIGLWFNIKMFKCESNLASVLSFKFPFLKIFREIGSRNTCNYYLVVVRWVKLWIIC